MNDGNKIELDWPRVVAALVAVAIGLIFCIKLMFDWRSDGRFSECQNNLQEVVTAAKKYAEKHNGRYPPDLGELVSSHMLRRLPTCPVANQMTFTDYQRAKFPAAMTVSCCGGHHKQQFKGTGDPGKFPTYSTWTEAAPKK